MNERLVGVGDDEVDQNCYRFWTVMKQFNFLHFSLKFYGFNTSIIIHSFSFVFHIYTYVFTVNTRIDTYYTTLIYTVSQYLVPTSNFKPSYNISLQAIQLLNLYHLYLFISISFLNMFHYQLLPILSFQNFNINYVSSTSYSFSI